MRTPDASTATFWTLPRAVGAAGAAHALAWSVLPPLYLGNLHTDTVEALSWASHWDWGYFKHPPLVVWLFKAALALPGPRLVNFLIISQLSVLISAALIWQNVRALKDAEAAAAAVCLYLASPPATYFAVQINHNSLSIPFDAAILCFGILFLEKRRTRDIAVLGVIVGFALLTKYQTAFFPMTLAILAVANPKYRWVWSDWRGYAAALLALLIFAPHVWWDFNHGWRTLLYASSDRPLRGWADIGLSLNELFDGMLMAAVGPIFCWFIMGRPRLTKSDPAVFRLGVGIAATPIVIMTFLGFLSGQVLRQGWLIPLIPSVAIGLGLAFKIGRTPSPSELAMRTIFVSYGQVAAFAAFLAVRAITGHAVAAYSLDGKTLASKIESEWRTMHKGPVPCMLIPNRTFGLSTMLWLKLLPQVFDLPTSPSREADLSPCAASGGVILTPEDTAANAYLDAQGLKSDSASVTNTPAIGANIWSFRIYQLERR